MIGKKVPFAEAYAKTIENKWRIFGSTGKGGSGFERSHGMDFPSIRHTPKFSLDKGSPVFTIGSCFARNIELSLVKHGIDCISTRCAIPDELYELTGIGARNGALNAYTPGSIRELIGLAVETGGAHHFGALDLGDGQWMDMMMSGLRILSWDELVLSRQKLYSTYADLHKAGTIIITLGYTESWFDTADRIYVNRSPGYSRRSMRLGDRYEFHNVNASDTIEMLEQSIGQIQSLNPHAKIVLTVSPVPLHATFTYRDVISANLYSKCTLLSAAVAIAQNYEFVDYYPSYEMVMYSDQSTAWLDDGVHVKQRVVDQVVAKFYELYYS